MKWNDYETAGLCLLQDDERFREWCELLRDLLIHEQWEESARWKQALGWINAIHRRVTEEATRG